MRYLLAFATVIFCWLSTQGEERLTLKGVVTTISDSLGYVATANVKTGDSVAYEFWLDNARQGYSQSAGGPVSWLKDTLFDGQPLDYIWDSLASVPRMSLGADPSLVMFRGTRITQDSNVVNVSLGDFRYDNHGKLKATCLNWREYKGTVNDSAYAGFETIEQTDSLGKKKSSYFYFSLVLVKRQLIAAQGVRSARSGPIAEKRTAGLVARLVCMPASSGVLYRSNGTYFDIRGRTVSPSAMNRAGMLR
jgi:hypothetical protein